MDYPELQIILAYNTPTPMPIERTLREIAAMDPRFVPFKVEHSTSKAQNVNAALSIATGEFVGVFDADSKPEAHNFKRAWAWLSNGAGIVQGHNAVRNGEASWVSRMVAVEFESIYSVSHPGRSRLHGFGIFGGSNGYWRTELLRRIRMHGSMLTEDIDSSMRVIAEGHEVVSDPGIICWELAPTHLRAVWHQRMRWAQGWFQVSIKHGLANMRSSTFTLQHKFGLAFLLGWREIYPWISIQMFPIIAFYAWKYGGVQKIDWLLPVFVFTTVFTLGTGPAQAFTAYKLGAPQITRHNAGSSCTSCSRRCSTTR